ncbi:MAG: TonB-dependent receptor [Betaproteobacteria bacterium]
MHPRYSLAASALALFTAFPANAADRDTDAVVVTATRQAVRANELLADVSSISREDIEKSGSNTIEELLSHQPGIQFFSNGGPGTSSGVYMRGTNPAHTVVLIDGQRVSSASTGTTTLSRIPLSQIDHIEILRGPASSLYGADAIGGVIQIFTKRGEGPAKFNASVGYGTYNTSETSAGVSGGTDIVSYSLQAGYTDTQGFNAYRNPKNTAYNRDRDGYSNTNISGNFSVRPAQGHEIGIKLFASNGSSQYDYRVAPHLASSDYINQENLASYSIYSKNKLAPNWTSTLRLGTSVDDSTNLDNGKSYSLIRTNQDQVSWQNDIKLPIGTALFAAEHLKQTVVSTNYANKDRTINSLLSGWTGSLGNNRFQFNLRRDNNSQFGGKTTGAASYGYQITDALRAHTSYGTAFRAPTFNELYYPGYGNPDVRPELAKNNEVGATWEQGPHRFSAVYFRNKVSDLIVSTLQPDKVTYLATNVGHATLKGTTLSYAGRFSDWSIGTSLDVQKTLDDDTGLRLVRRANQQMSSYVRRSYGAWSFGTEWQLVGERYNDAKNTVKLGGYGLVNLMADYRLEKDWTLFAKANNIFDKTYELVSDYATPGANVFVGVRYSPK